MRLSRGATIAAPPGSEFARSNDLQSFTERNPVAKLQPQNAITHGTVQQLGKKSPAVTATMHGPMPCLNWLVTISAWLQASAPCRGEMVNPSFPLAEATPCEVIGRVASQRADGNASKALGRRTK